MFDKQPKSPWLLYNKIGFFDEVTSIIIIRDCHITMDHKSRCVCGKRGTKWCSRCKAQRYCGIECQRHDWDDHTCNKTQSSKPGDILSAWARGAQRGAIGMDIDGLEKLPLAQLQRESARQAAVVQRIKAKMNIPDRGFYKFLTDHIEARWDETLQTMQSVAVDNKAPVTWFFAINPNKSVLFAAGIPKPAIVTMSITITASQPDAYTFAFSDHRDGVMQRVHAIPPSKPLQPGDMIWCHPRLDNTQPLPGCGAVEVKEEPMFTNFQYCSPDVYMVIDWNTGDLNMEPQTLLSLIEQFEK